MRIKYVIVSPIRDEIEFIERTLESVVGQNIRPAEYILVDDGSNDGTEKVIADYADRYDWISVVTRTRKEHHPGAGVMEAFYAGFETISNKDWDFVVKLDGDLDFAPDYFELLLKKFDENPKLGIASGKTYQPYKDGLKLDKMPDDHTRGPSKVYKRECFEAIGGLQRVWGWDTLDELKAQVLGYETRSYIEISLVHLKPTGVKQKQIFRRELRAGERQHFLGYHPLFALSRGVYRMFQKPFFIAGILNIIGFVLAEVKRTEQIGDRDIIRHLRHKQLGRLSFRRKLIG